MKYLVVMRECYECDNNTPSNKIWAKIVEFKDEHEKEQAEKVYLNEYVEDEAIDAEIQFVPLDELEEWVRVSEIW